MPSLVDIPASERAFRDEALLYFVSRHDRATASLAERQLDAFRSFVGLWLETLDWRTGDGIGRYLEIAEPQRLERIERFRRQAASWDVTLEFPVETNRAENEERERWHRQHERAKKRRQRREEDEAKWQAVREMLDAEQRLRTMPSWLRESFQFLGLGPKANLAEARRRYRELAKKLHPDSGGSSQQMAALNDAWKKVEEFFLA
jgi:hypothetical protein